MEHMKIPYYPGCTLNTVAKQFDTSAREAASIIGFEMKELAQWNCCGATFPLTPDNVLKRTNKVIRDNKEKRNVINGFIEEEYDGSVNILHYLEVLRDKVGFDKVKGAVKRPLTGIKAATYYGCMLLRPFEDIGIDNAERPTIFEDLLRALGAEPVEFGNKIECCGAHLAMNNEEVVTNLSGKVMTSAVDAGADLIVTTCPLCQFNLEKSQPKVAEADTGYRPVPVVYFTQALGLALGQGIETLGV